MVKAEGDISFIEPKILRYAGKADIPQLMFQYSKERGYHVGCGVKSMESDPDKKAELKMADAWKVCEKIFSGPNSYSRQKAIKQIMIKKACQERTAAGIFALMNADEILNFKGEDDNYRLNKQYSNALQ